MVIRRRSFLQFASALALLPLVPGGFAAEPLKIGIVGSGRLGEIGRAHV